MKSFQPLLTNIVLLLKKNRLEVMLILLIVLVAAFLRFYRLSEYMTFLGDEGRDALMVQRILTTFDIPLIGPPSSVGNVYLGPLYYYMMTFPMAIFWLNPVAAVFLNALIGTVVVMFIYYFARAWFGFYPALLASSLYAISPVTIVYSRSSWNPNPLPFFTLLAIFGVYKIHQTGNFRWLILTGGSLAFALQMHYFALILIPIFGLLYIYEIFVDKEIRLKKYILTGTIFSIVSFFLLMSPLVVFDIKHNFLNYRAMSELLFGKQSSSGFSYIDFMTRIVPIYKDNLIQRYMTGDNQILSFILSVLIFLPIIFSLKYILARKRINFSFILLTIWFLGGLMGLSIYKQDIYDHYLNIINPAPYLLLSGFIFFLIKKWQVLAILVIILILGYFNLSKNLLLHPPNRQLQRTQELTRFIIDKADNKPFNFALIAARNYDSAYQFILSIYGHKAKKLPFDMTDQLFVTCEDPVCDPTHNSKYEIAAFGWSKIEKEYEVLGVKIFKLVHNPTGEP